MVFKYVGMHWCLHFHILTKVHRTYDRIYLFNNTCTTLLYRTLSYSDVTFLFLFFYFKYVCILMKFVVEWNKFTFVSAIVYSH